MNATLRLGAATGAASGILIAAASSVEIVTGEIPLTGLALGIAPALGLPLIVALHLAHKGKARTFGVIAYGLNLVGLGLFGGAAFALNLVLIHLDPAVTEGLPGAATAALLGSALVFSAGTILFGIAMLRAGLYPRLPAAVYAFAFPLIALLAPLPDNLFISAVHIASGAALVWLAHAVNARARVSSDEIAFR
ncbi:hypothetical protein [Glycomyces dulcitolivorans]|uniref:hypothetical protein n=1 Tax=Glycomyces dulcitolivorans TaxID=2200759 RepID=UPI000DD35DCB|nr:hypothetical protein [Glycomyces dulcitolivorans]